MSLALKNGESGIRSLSKLRKTPGTQPEKKYKPKSSSSVELNSTNDLDELSK